MHGGYNMLLIFMVPLLGIGVAALINKLFPNIQFKGADVLPFFFIPACNLITRFQKRPSFLPYGFIFFIILVIIYTVHQAYINKNIAMKKILYQLWEYLIICSVIWYLGLLVMMLI